jgi:uncharacterized protein (TIGR02246 family)
MKTPGTKTSAMRTLTAVFFCLTLLSGCAGTVNSESTSQYIRQQIVDATAAWGAAYDSRDPARITVLYAPQAVLWGLSAKRLANTPEAVAEYFKAMPQTPDNRVVLGPQNIHMYGDLATNSGYYTFRLAEGGKMVDVPARYSFVFRHDGRRWLIVQHHSSRLP